MAMYWLLSFVCLLASLAAAQDSSGAGTKDVIITKSVTQTVTKYLAQCGITLTPFELPDSTLAGTLTVTSTLQSTISITVPNVTTVSVIAPAGLPTGLPTSLGPLPPIFNYTTVNLTQTYSTLGTVYPLANSSTPPANTTKIPCSTATVVITTTIASSSHSVTPIYSTYSTPPASIPPTPIPVSKSSTLGNGAFLQSVVGALGILLLLMAGFL
ncbi:hypothetical protein F4804DRAFT_166505 [Jackrogersella minutella]|nr:hypothetical protein F4804DRAFT_166505 [Jackrogersella minutella]